MQKARTMHQESDGKTDDAKSGFGSIKVSLEGLRQCANK